MRIVSSLGGLGFPIKTKSCVDTMSALGMQLRASMMEKPPYSDCWIVGNREGLKVIESYSMPLGDVVIGMAPDGEIEYNIVPKDHSYEQKLADVVNEAVDTVRAQYRKKGGAMDRQSLLMSARDVICRRWAGSEKVSLTLDELCDTIYRNILGLGIFDVLLSDDRIEDIYVDAPCTRNRVYITLNRMDEFNSHFRCRTNLVLEHREVKNLINRLKKATGLPYGESNPVLETDMSDGEARATVVGYPMSPNGDSVAIRKHSAVPWTLTRLIGNGSISPESAGLLSFFVENRSSILICGARGAGKSSLLSALMFEFPLSQRILTIEDTIELPAKRMRNLGYKIQTILINDRLGGDNGSRADDALRVSLRLGESAIVLGEVRGEEAKTLYQSMRTGKAGSSIMGTMHGDSARSVYERAVHDLGVSPEAFTATDLLITMGTFKDRGGAKTVRSLMQLVATSDVPGEFIDILNGNRLCDCPAVKRILSLSDMTEADLYEEVEIRAEMRRFLADTAKQHGDRFYGPEWIVLANDHLSKQLDAGVRDRETILEGFKFKVIAEGGSA